MRMQVVTEGQLGGGICRMCCNNLPCHYDEYSDPLLQVYDKKAFFTICKYSKWLLIIITLHGMNG